MDLFNYDLFADAGAGGGGIVQAAAAGGADYAVLSAIRDALEATRQFASVTVNRPPASSPHPADDTAAADVSPAPDGWDDLDAADDFDGSWAVEHSGRCVVTIMVIRADNEGRYAELNRLEQVVKAAVNGQPFGFALPSLTLCRRGRYSPPAGPEQRCVISVDYRAHVQGAGNFDQS